MHPTQIQPQRHIIHFGGNINPATVHNIKSVTLQALSSHRNNQAIPPVSELHYMFFSEGGDVPAGIALYNFLRGLDKPVIMHNYSSIESIATIIFLAADTRYVVPGGRFLFHDFSLNFPSAVVDAPKLLERARSIDSYADIYTNIFRERIQGAEKSIDLPGIFGGKACIMDAETAVKAGVAHKIVPPDGLIDADAMHWMIAP